MADNENKTIKNEKIVFKDEVYPYIDGNNKLIHEDNTSFDENMEKANNVEISRNTYVYTNAEDSFNENMSTAWSFLGIGAAGTIFTLLNIAHILHIMQGFMQMGVALVLFLGFMIYGIIVIRSKKEMLAKVEKEKADRNKYKDWMKEKFTEEVLSNLGTMEASAEELELLQINYMSEELVRYFPEINPNFADRLAEEFFEEKNF